MKTKSIMIISTVLVVVLLVVTFSISSNNVRITDIAGMTFQELCEKNSDMWMNMEAWIGGEKISDNMCYGCMINDNHFCTAKEYVEYIKKMQGTNSMDAMMDDGMGMMHTMAAMTAHAGNENSVDVMMYNVEFERGSFSVGNQTELKFIIKDSMTGESVSDLEIMHEKIMHVVLVRKDLKYFDHIHPIQIQEGVFSVPYSFYAPGEYRIWIDFTVDGMQHIVDFDTTVSGTSETAQPDRVGNLNIEMKLSEKIEMGKSIKLDFIITDSSNKPVLITEEFLAANAHMIVVDESLDEFGHAHDENFDKDNVISFGYSFKTSSLHKLWIQFSVNGKTIIKEFEVKVE